MLGQHDRHLTAGEMAEVNFREPELYVVGRNRDVTPGNDGEAAAEYPTVDFRDHRLRHLTEHLVAPLARLLPHLVAHPRRLRVHFDKVLFEILSGAKAFTRSGDYYHSGVFVVA